MVAIAVKVLMHKLLSPDQIRIDNSQLLERMQKLSLSVYWRLLDSTVIYKIINTNIVKGL